MITTALLIAALYCAGIVVALGLYATRKGDDE